MLISKRMTHVIDHLYIGSVYDVNDDFLKTNQIRTVINVAKECNYELTALTHQDNITYYHFEIEDNLQNISHCLHKIPEIIDKSLKLGPVLIHCKAGLSRSPTFVLSYMIQYEFIDLFTALQQIRELRPILPNPGFMYQLIELEEFSIGTKSYQPYIDEYVAVYIARSLNLGTSEIDTVVNTYINTNRDIWETIRRIRSKQGSYNDI